MKHGGTSKLRSDVIFNFISTEFSISYKAFHKDSIEHFNNNMPYFKDLRICIFSITFLASSTLKCFLELIAS